VFPKTICIAVVWVIFSVFDIFAGTTFIGNGKCYQSWVFPTTHRPFLE